MAIKEDNSNVGEGLMKNATPALVSFLLSKRACYIADLFTFSLSNGSTYTWTSSDQPILSNGVVYQAIGPLLTRSRISIKNTIDVPEMTITLLSNGTDFDGGLNIKNEIHNGLLDGAYVQINRVYMPTYGDTSLGAPLMFGGRVSQVQIGAKGAKISVKGDNVLMQQYIPRNVYSISCIHTLFDTGCTLNAADFTFDFHLGASNPVFLNWIDPPGDTSQFVLGVATMTSGEAVGESRTVISAQTFGIQLIYPFYKPTAPGDTFSVTFGCDRSIPVCVNRFNNLQHRRGFDYIPPAEIGV